MSQQLVSPLADIIRRAAERKPEGKIAAIRQRFAEATEELVILVDDSGSMSSTIGTLQNSKRDHAEAALADVLKYHPQARIVAFSDRAQLLDQPKLPCLDGGTNFLPALAIAARFKPRKTVIISDGCPTDNHERILEAVSRMTGSIDTIFCGADDDPGAKFLQLLAKDTGGIRVTWDGYGPAQLSATLCRMIAAPTEKQP